MRGADCRLGAGGAARAVGYARWDAGARQVRFGARKTAGAETLARDLSPLWPETVFMVEAQGPAALWVNATPMGLEGFPEKFPVKIFRAAS